MIHVYLIFSWYFCKITCSITFSVCSSFHQVMRDIWIQVMAFEENGSPRKSRRVTKGFNERERDAHCASPRSPQLAVINRANRFDVRWCSAGEMQSRMQCLSFIDAACAGAGVRRPVIEGTPFNWISNDRIVSVAFAIARVSVATSFADALVKTLHATISTRFHFSEIKTI
jgi:hypothetical protein